MKHFSTWLLLRMLFSDREILPSVVDERSPGSSPPGKRACICATIVTTGSTYTVARARTVSGDRSIHVEPSFRPIIHDPTRAVHVTTRKADLCGIARADVAEEPRGCGKRRRQVRRFYRPPSRSRTRTRTHARAHTYANRHLPR